MKLPIKVTLAQGYKPGNSTGGSVRTWPELLSSRDANILGTPGPTGRGGGEPRSTKEPGTWDPELMSSHMNNYQHLNDRGLLAGRLS